MCLEAQRVNGDGLNQSILMPRARQCQGRTIPVHLGMPSDHQSLGSDQWELKCLSLLRPPLPVTSSINYSVRRKKWEGGRYPVHRCTRSSCRFMYLFIKRKRERKLQTGGGSRWGSFRALLCMMVETVFILRRTSTVVDCPTVVTDLNGSSIPPDIRFGMTVSTIDNCASSSQ